MDPQEIPLRDLHLPAMTDWWPLAPGWWLLLLLAVFAALWALRRAWMGWRQNAARRYALRQLSGIVSEFESGADPVRLGKQLSELLRRAMLAYAPRSEVAGLTGGAWLEWLDRGLDDRPFSEGGGRMLETLPYMNPGKVDNDTDLAALIAAVKRRLQTPLGDRAIS